MAPESLRITILTLRNAPQRMQHTQNDRGGKESELRELNMIPEQAVSVSLRHGEPERVLGTLWRQNRSE